MRIAVLMENSQASKNAIVVETLRNVVEPLGHQVVNYGMFGKEGEVQLTYVHLGLLASLILSTKAADFVITGCGTGEGAMLACNAFPAVLCGLVENPTDAYLFAQINDGNAVAIPFAKGFGWGAEINLRYLFEKLFSFPFGEGYPKERVIPEQRNKKVLDQVKTITHRSIFEIVKTLDPSFVKTAVQCEGFQTHFFSDTSDEQMVLLLRELCK